MTGPAGQDPPTLPGLGTPGPTGRVPAPRRMLLALLATAAGIGAGHLAGGLVSPSSAPVLAVADRVVENVPPALAELAIATFGAADKIVLLAGVLALLVGVSALGGGLSGRDERRGTAVLAVLGGIGVLAVVTGPAFGPLDLLAPAAALLVAVWVWRRLYGLARRAARATGGPSASRRRLLVWSAAAGVGAVVTGAAGTALGAGLSAAGGTPASRAEVTRRLAAATVRRAPALPAGADTGVPGATPFVTANADFYRIDTALRVPALRAEDWRLRVHGMVARELDLGFDDLMRRPLVERWMTMTCVSNEVGGTLVSTARFVGVELAGLLAEAGPAPGADQILSTSTDGWTAGTPTGVVLEPGRGALLAVGMNGEALPREHGFPVRMVVPGLYGYVSATKWVEELELTTFGERSSYWADRGWGVLGPVKTASRIDVPGPFADVRPGPVVVAGTAWSQPRGIAGVEVRVDGGPWVAATLGAEVSGSTWRMWRAVVDLAPGGHTVDCRATDADGRTQTDAVAPVLPDGATGWPSRRVTAR